MRVPISTLPYTTTTTTTTTITTTRLQTHPLTAPIRFPRNAPPLPALYALYSTKVIVGGGGKRSKHVQCNEYTTKRPTEDQHLIKIRFEGSKPFIERNVFISTHLAPPKDHSHPVVLLAVLLARSVAVH